MIDWIDTLLNVRWVLFKIVFLSFEFLAALNSKKYGILMPIAAVIVYFFSTFAINVSIKDSSPKNFQIWNLWCYSIFFVMLYHHNSSVMI
jgi:hypothetical protein